MTNDLRSVLGRTGSILIGACDSSIWADPERSRLTKRIAAEYSSFEDLRDALLERRPVCLRDIHTPLLCLISNIGFAERVGETWLATGAEARRYLSGGWLEEYVSLAVAELGAEEVYTSQKVQWRVKDFLGENEIDVLARFGDTVFMCSCKTLKSSLEANNVRMRERLMQSLHEADNLADHFTPSGGVVALAVTTDLFDEETDGHRYQQLHGKAAALGVHLITLEHMPWPRLLERLTFLLAAGRSTG